jgi:hypothetical protein
MDCFKGMRIQQIRFFITSTSNNFEEFNYEKIFCKKQMHVPIHTRLCTALTSPNYNK